MSDIKISKINIRAIIRLPKSLFDAFFGYDFFISYAHEDGGAYPKSLARILSH